MDIVWRAEARAEAAAERHLDALAVSFDIASFYEVIDHNLLAQKAMGTGYPVICLRAALRQYKTARYITMHGAVAEPLATNKGVVAGDAFATSLVKAFYFTLFENLEKTWPGMCQVYLDDLTLTAAGNRHSIAKKIVQAAKQMCQAVPEQLGAEIAWDKTGIAATSKGLAKEVAAQLPGPTPVVPQGAYTLLGVETRQAGGWRAKGTKNVRAKRVKVADRRARKAKMFTRMAGGQRAAKLFVAGVKPVAAYAAEVTGICTSMLERLRTWFVALRMAKPSGASKAAALLLHGDPMAPLAVAACHRWAKEAWGTGVDPSGRLRATELQKLYWAAPSPKKWRQVRGPLGATKQELQRIGWS